MIDVKADFSGGLDLDNSYYTVGKNSYIDGLNITRDAVQGSNDMAITNIVGNQLVDYDFPSGVIATPTQTVVGAYTDIEIDFSGLPSLNPGFQVVINLYDLISGQSVVAADFTSTVHTTLDDLATEMANSMTSIGLPGVISISTTNNVLYFSIPSDPINDPAYSFTSITITNVPALNRNVCIGAYPNTVRNTIVYFIWNQYDIHLVLEYNQESNSISPIFQNLIDSDNVDILEFLELNKITSVNIINRNEDIGEGDLLFFLDSLGRPTTMDILRFKVAEYVPVTRDIINVIKRPPLLPISCVYGNDLTRNSNNLRNRLFRFKYRYVYDNNERSVCSPISKIPLPVNILKDEYNNQITNNNQITLVLDTGDKDVKDIEILMSYVEKTNDWSDFSLIDTISKKSIKGLSANLTLTPNPVLPDINDASIYLSGNVYPGINIFITMTRLSPLGSVVLASYVTVPGDTLQSVATEIYNQINSLPPGVIEYNYQYGDNTIVFGYDRTLYSFSQSQIQIDNVISNFDNFQFSYVFNNSGTYPVIDPNESIQIFDYVPDVANAQEVPNGNVLLYGGITEGYDNDLLPNVVNTINTNPTTGIIQSNLEMSFRETTNGVDFQEFEIDIYGAAAVGTVINIYMQVVSTGDIVLAASYTTVAGDTPTTIASALVNDAYTRFLPSPPYPPGFQVIYSIRNFYFSNPSVPIPKLICQSNNTGVPGVIYRKWQRTDIIPPGTGGYNSIPTFLFSTEREIGIAYFNKNGKTNGIVYNGKLSFPQYSEDLSENILLPYVNTKIYHQPPIWAHSFGFYLTKENTQFLYWETINVLDDTEFLYFDVSNIQLNQKKSPTTTNVLSYKFKDGDRMRLIKEAKPAGAWYNDTYDAEIIGQVVDPKINNVDTTGIFIKIRKFAPFSLVNYSNKYFIIQLYTPSQSLPNDRNLVFYEFGQQYLIGDPGLPTRYHNGMVTNQNLSLNYPAEFNFYEGDVYFRGRTIVLSEPGGSTSSGYASYNTLDRNFVDSYISAVNSIDGRSSVIDINQRKTYFSSMVRFSQAYQPNTNINGTNRFFPLNFDEYDYSYGDIMRFTVRDRFVRVFQKLKIGQVPLYHQILKEQNKENLVVSDKLLNPIQYYVGDVGIGDHPESLASYRFADYFASNIRGVICRVSNDGIVAISATNKVDSWANSKLPLRTQPYKMYGAFEPKLSQYILALEETPTDPAVTLSFHEKNNTFESFLSYRPEMMCSLRTNLISFKGGKLYTHNSPTYNNFYGEQYDSEITFVFNMSSMNKKTFLALSQLSSSLFDVPSMKTDLNSYGLTKMESNLVDSDFQYLEGNYEAAILRDLHSDGGILNGDTMKGKYLLVKFRNQNTSDLISLSLVSLKYIDSPLNVR